METVSCTGGGKHFGVFVVLNIVVVFVIIFVFVIVFEFVIVFPPGDKSEPTAGGG